jgi:hypothetical protein
MHHKAAASPDLTLQECSGWHIASCIHMHGAACIYSYPLRHSSATLFLPSELLSFFHIPHLKIATAPNDHDQGKKVTQQQQHIDMISF